MGIKFTLPAEEAVEYVPDFGDNRDRAAAGEAAMVVKLLPMSGADHDKLHSSMMGGKRVSGTALIKRAQAFVKRLICEQVTEVEGYELCDQNGMVVERPSNGAELYRAIMLSPPAAGAIIDDIVDALKDQSSLTEGELGNLRRRSDSSPPKTHRSATGLAESVAGSNGTQKAQSRLSSNSESAYESVSSSGEAETATVKRIPTSKGQLRGTSG